MSKRPGDVILLHICTINHDHMMYGSQDIKCKRQSFFVIMGHILPFDSPNWKNQNFEKKFQFISQEHLYNRNIHFTSLEISSFYASAPRLMIIGYTVLEIWCVADVTVVFHFGQFFAILLPKKIKIKNSPKNQNFKKMKITSGDIILHMWFNYN